MNLVGLFTENLLPVFLAAATGFILAAILRPDPRPISHVAFYVLAPCMVFQLIVDNHVTTEALLRMVGFTLVVLLAGAALAALVARALRWPRVLASAVALAVLIPNSGNYGLSVNAFAFGDEGLAQASLFFVTASVLTFTVGVLVVSLGRTSPKVALAGLFRVPAIWAVVVALGLVRLGWSLPSPVAKPVAMFSQACVPVFLVVLGMQLHVSRPRGPWAPLVFVVGMRLVGGAVLALGCAPLFGLEGRAHQSGILQAAMPSAVICTILASEYDVEPGFVTSAVFFSTLLSPFTLTPLLAYLLG
jgi:predicted permease